MIGCHKSSFSQKGFSANRWLVLIELRRTLKTTGDAALIWGNIRSVKRCLPHLWISKNRQWFLILAVLLTACSKHKDSHEPLTFL
jgi:hypothetical protein